MCYFLFYTGVHTYFFNLVNSVVLELRTVPTILSAHMFCASQDTQVSYGWCLLIQGYFCVV